MSAPSLTLLDVRTAKARADFDAKFDEMAKAVRLGKPPYDIGRAAHAAWMACMALSEHIAALGDAAEGIDGLPEASRPSAPYAIAEANHSDPSPDQLSPYSQGERA